MPVHAGLSEEDVVSVADCILCGVRKMSDIDIPIFIATPLAGQGEVFNEDWMRARIDLFEAVTLPSMLTQLKDGVHWMIFIEETPEL